MLAAFPDVARPLMGAAFTENVSQPDVKPMEKIVGLDICFIISGQKEEFLYLRKHWDFFYRLAEYSAQPHHRDCTDFYVDAETLLSIDEDLEHEGAETDIRIDEDFERACGDGDDSFTNEQQGLRFQRHVVHRLLSVVEKHGPVICAWSA